MASPNPPVPAASTTSPLPGYSCSQTLAYLFLRLMVSMILLLAGIEKFKSPTPPYGYSITNWHGTIENGEVVGTPGRWLTVAKPVFDFSGLNNENFFHPTLSRTIGWTFYFYAQVLPYAMVIVGFFILIGFLNRVFMVLGSCIWLSLAAGQAMLPDNPTVLMLLNYSFFTIAALALVRYNRFAVTRF